MHLSCVVDLDPVLYSTIYRRVLEFISSLCLDHPHAGMDLEDTLQRLASRKCSKLVL